MQLRIRASCGPSLVPLIAALLFISSAWAQIPPGLPAGNQNTPTTTESKPASNAASASNSNASDTAKTGSTPATTATTRSTSDASSSDSKSDKTDTMSNTKGRSTTSSSRAGVTITPTATNSGAASSTSSPSAPPTITGNGSSAGTLPHNLPTLSGAYSYPPPSVPPTARAPFMQHSTLPEGTVFIIVGTFLGFLGFSILAWRGLVVWSVHRSVKRAALEQNMADSKAMLRPRGNGLYTAGPGSTLSLDHLTANRQRASSYGRKGHASTGSLFFSPTARAVSMVDPSTNRASTYLPGGYYPASNSTPGGGAAGAGQGTVHLGTPSSRVRSRGPTPPISPSLSPSRGNIDLAYPSAQGRHSHHVTAAPSQASTSSLNLSVPPQGARTPSAYLDDLFESHRSQPTNRNGDPLDRY